MGRPIQPVSLVAQGDPSYFAIIDTVTPAQNLHHVSLFNGSTDKRVLIHRLSPINLSIAAVTGVGLRFDIKRATAVSAGTDVAPDRHDSNDPALPASILVKRGATVTEGGLILPVTMSNDEILLTGAATDNAIRASSSFLPDSVNAKPFTLRPGEGITVKQITNSVVGSFAWLAVFTTPNLY